MIHASGEDYLEAVDACRIEHAISQDTFEKIRDAHKQEK